MSLSRWQPRWLTPAPIVTWAESDHSNLPTPAILPLPQYSDQILTTVAYIILNCMNIESQAALGLSHHLLLLSSWRSPESLPTVISSWVGDTQAALSLLYFGCKEIKTRGDTGPVLTPHSTNIHYIASFPGWRAGSLSPPCQIVSKILQFSFIFHQFRIQFWSSSENKIHLKTFYQGSTGAHHGGGVNTMVSTGMFLIMSGLWNSGTTGEQADSDVWGAARWAQSRFVSLPVVMNGGGPWGGTRGGTQGGGEINQLLWD